MCYEQMDGKALGFVGRGMGRKVSMPFEVRPETCRLCRGCDYVCPGDHSLPRELRSPVNSAGSASVGGDAELLSHGNLWLLLRTEPPLGKGFFRVLGIKLRRILLRP